MGFFSTPTDQNLKKAALAAYSKLDRLEDRQKVGELFINHPTINGYIFNPSPIMQAKRLKQQYNKKGENTVEPKNFGKYYFGIGTTNNDPGAGAALNDIMAQFGTPVLGMRIEKFIEKEMMLEGKDQDAAYQILLDSVKTIPERNTSPEAELDDLFNSIGKNAKKISIFGGNAKKNHNRRHKTKRARKTRRTRRNNKKRSA